ncbi:hypothetical protein CJP74_05945 [Psittacicella melopsittaci]|uniref:Aldose 1-epimerase n=1 Tax=Psittacicella melopsittaci TaxID=2028576 RepID=A0A3A1Y3V0_9GAMM|nr:galactose mutarotase [Psittacicella melopsittaci]RIY31898.1 hypothetical protein CJP74_05945 [Psittacicella melopsittaci]
MPQVQVYEISNKAKTRVQILNFGGAVHGFYLAKQPEQNLVVSTDLDSYATNPFNINLMIGRVAGRIKNAQFELEGNLISLPANQGANCLHGGPHGMAQQWFEGQLLAPDHLQLTTTLRGQVDKFPGDLKVTIDYFLSQDNQLQITYTAQALEQATVFDPTAHIYWRTFARPDTCLTIKGQHIALDPSAIPLAPSHLEAYNLEQGKRLEQIKQGFDEVYAVQPGLVATLEVPEHYKLEVFGQKNALVVFFANPTDFAAHDRGEYSSIALEPQTMPDSLNQPQWGNIRLRAGQQTQVKISFKVTEV